ncbi:Rhomboid-like protein [Glarea lozoyensis ATCC 20868]|uniref:Rhomboid-like protein n=1 Tax=Glarea lozoyensis (strain ATCC 20868 / MF5171) TaxID=1116229 RepID=S3DBU0_GLAL2|nr:Rhomboid-like protein [Glarea lozoyensis ATCC 20868]EPE34574.1 Rhomboid-like protein [Glarea lozoyensis ATCC 20868]
MALRCHNLVGFRAPKPPALPWTPDKFMHSSYKPAQSQRRFSQTPITPKSTRIPRSPRTSLDNTRYNRKHSVPPEPEPQPRPTWYFGEKVALAIIVPCTALFTYKFFNECEISWRGAAASPGAVQRMIQYNKTFVFSMRNVEEGRWWTGLFISLGVKIIHFAGLKRFGLIYLGAGIVGNLVQYYWWKRTLPENKDAGAVSASASVLGLVGFMTGAVPHAKVTSNIFSLTLWKFSAGILGLSIASLYSGWLPELGHAAHFVGMIFGRYSVYINSGLLVTVNAV